MSRIFAVVAGVALTASAAYAAERDAPESGFGRLDHVFLIMMENQTSSGILGNANAPFINAYTKLANQATDYFAVGHPSAPNYLEIAGGSNFGVPNDYWPNWVGTGCIDNAPASTGCNNAVTPIAVAGLDNPVVATATDPTSATARSRSAGRRCPTTARSTTIRRLVHPEVDRRSAGRPPQALEDLSGEPAHRASPASRRSITPMAPGRTSAPRRCLRRVPIQKLYAVKHDPFVYFQNVEVGEEEQLSLEQVKDFDGSDGLWADLQTATPRTLPSSFPTSVTTCTASSPAGRRSAPRRPPPRAGCSWRRAMPRCRSSSRASRPRPPGTSGRNVIVAGVGRERLLQRRQSRSAAGRNQLRARTAD